MSKTIQAKVTWFMLSDKWHRESLIHCVVDGEKRSICGGQDINEINSESLIPFATIDEIPLKDLCKHCLRKML